VAKAPLRSDDANVQTDGAAGSATTSEIRRGAPRKAGDTAAALSTRAGVGTSRSTANRAAARINAAISQATRRNRPSERPDRAR